MKIFQVASGFSGWGGIERHVLVLSEKLLAHGHDVAIVVRPDSWVEEQAALIGIRTYPIRIMKQSDRQDLGKLTNLFLQERPDVLHVHVTSDLITHGLAARRASVPVKILSHHLPAQFRNRIGAYAYSKILYQRIVPVSESVARSLRSGGVPADRIQVIHHGTDVDTFADVKLSYAEARREIGIPEGALAVGIVGRVSIEKGHEDFVRAIDIVRRQHNVRGVIIGDGPVIAQLRSLVQELGLEDSILWTGFRNDVNLAMSALDIVAVPSTWQEPCSAVIQQGMALSKPVVGTNVGGTPEMIVDHTTGLLVPPNDPDALANAFERLLANEQLRVTMGSSGRKRVEQYFSLNGMVGSLEQLYSELR